MPDLYLPSSGFEGMDFSLQWCDRCDRDKHNDCRIRNNSFHTHVSQWIYDEDGKPTCTEFEEAKP